MKTALRLLAVVLALTASPNPSLADWTVDGNVVSTADDLQMNPAMASDGGTGVFVTWQDRRDGTSFNIYVQRFDETGNAVWTANGVAVCLEANDQTDPKVVSDGAGGAIVVWEDARTSTNFDVYVQRVDADGNPMWTTDGVALCALDLNQHNPTIVSDDLGGAVVAWQDHRGGQPDIYAQRVDADGNALWAEDGVEVCTAARAQNTPVAVADGGEGAVVCWVDKRAGLGDIYVQRIDADGNALWTTNGVALCTDLEEQSVPALVVDQLGGAYVAWADKRDGNLDIYAQYVDFDGVVQWTANGLAVCAQPGDQNNPAIVGDGLATFALGVAPPGGAIIAWEDFRSGLHYDIYASHVDGGGNFAWTANGVALCTAPLNQVKPVITSDANHGAIVAWQDHRPNFTTDVYARRVDQGGSPQWDADGVRLCGAADNQFDPVIAFADAGAAIVAWEDLRTGTYDVYAQRAAGAPTAVAILSFSAVPSVEGVVLHAAFRSDLVVEGVNVYRGGPSGSLTKIGALAGVGGEMVYVDRTVEPGATYRYQIGVVDADGEFWSPIVALSVAALSAALDQNRPNPFNPSTTIRFVVPEREHVSLAVYDASGRAVRTLVDAITEPGAREVVWDGRDDRGVAQSSGVYFYRLSTGKRAESRKMVLLK